jgi:hypothetical protein
MNASHYIGLDVHKKTISYCLKMAGPDCGRRQTGSRAYGFTALVRRPGRRGMAPWKPHCSVPGSVAAKMAEGSAPTALILC